MAGERPERDVLAEALHDIDGREEPTADYHRRTHEIDADAILAAVAARGYTLSKSAPDSGYTTGARWTGWGWEAATPPAEPAP